MAKTEKKTAEEYVTIGDGYADIELASEITVGGVKVKKLRMREMLVRDQLVMKESKSAAENEMTVFGNLCDISPEEILSLSLRSYKRLQAAFFGLTD